MRLIAVIDIGSHSTKLEIFKINQGKKVKSIFKRNDYLYLFEDINSLSYVSNTMINNLSLLLLKYKEIISFYCCKKTKVIATSALREATNSKEVVSFIKDKTDLSIEVISGDQEACFSQLAFLSLKLKSPFSVIFDLGGGSTEVSLFKNNKALFSHSFDIGVIRCANDNKPEEWSKLQDFILSNNNDLPLCVGLGSSVRRFAQMIKQKKHKNGFIIKKSSVDSFNDIMINNDFSYIKTHYNLNGLKCEYLNTIISLLSLFYKILKIDKIYYYPISIRKGVALSELNNKKG